ncbi:MAG: hypothetical protein GY810_13620 [Aureispira sp.]|nr:hypothetical protein [Aureispira sp.]
MLNTVYQLSFFRAKQLFRVMKDLGVVLLLLMLPLLTVLVLRVLELLSTQNPFLVAGLIVFSLLSMHFVRQDIGLLKLLKAPLPVLFFTEYSLALLPFSLTVVFLGNWWTPIYMHAGLLLVSLLPASLYKKTTQKRSWLALEWIPLGLFEWRSGFRKYWGLIAFMYILGFILPHFMGTLFIVVFLLTMTFTSFFENLESKELIEILNDKNQLLTQKAWMMTRSFHLFLLPHYILFLIFHSQYWYLLLLLMIVTQLILLFSLCYKYTSYRPDSQRIYMQIPLAFYAASMLIPFLQPLGIIMVIYFWRKAQRNLFMIYA